MSEFEDVPKHTLEAWENVQWARLNMAENDDVFMFLVNELVIVRDAIKKRSDHGKP